MKTIETWFASVTEQFSSVFRWKGQNFVARWTDILRCLRANMNSPAQSVLKMHKVLFVCFFCPHHFVPVQPYSPDLPPCDYIHFPNITLKLKDDCYPYHSIGWHILSLLFCNVILTTVSAVNESVLHCFDDMMTWQCFDVISCHYVSYSCHNMSHVIPPYVCTTRAVRKTNY